MTIISGNQRAGNENKPGTSRAGILASSAVHFLGKTAPAASSPETSSGQDTLQVAQSSALPVITTLAGFDAALKADGPVLVKFEKPHCPACEAAESLVADVAAANSGKLTVVKARLWDETNPDNRNMKRLAHRYQLKTVPVFMLFQQGQTLAKEFTPEGLLKMLEEHQFSLPETEPSDMPAPYVPPGAKLTVLFDGQCSICKASAEKLKTLDAKDRLALVPLQSRQVRAKYPDLKLVELRKSIHVVDDQGRVFKGAAAFREMGRLIEPQNFMGTMMKAFVQFSKIPGVLSVTDKLYLAFSKRRFMFQAKQADCKHCTLEE